MNNPATTSPSFVRTRFVGPYSDASRVLSAHCCFLCLTPLFYSILGDCQGQLEVPKLVDFSIWLTVD